MRFNRCILASLLFAASVASARADVFDFSYTQGNVDPDSIYLSISGTITASATATPDVYSITNVSGTEILTIAGSSYTSDITGVLSPDPSYSADNLLYTSGLVPYLDEYGFTFTTDGNGSDSQGDVNIAYLTAQSVYTTPYEGPAQNGAFTVSSGLTGVPEPASITMVLGFLALGVALRKAQDRT